ncbi:MAG: DUF4349 domain-containing protein [Chloroflexi bacterium]|nr:DUF4349 domain-containing protein [Chloroflexota bacterium]
MRDVIKHWSPKARWALGLLLLLLLGYGVLSRFEVRSSQFQGEPGALLALEGMAPLQKVASPSGGVDMSGDWVGLGPDSVAAAPLPLDRMVIKQAYVEAYVDDPAAALDATRTWVKQAGGYVVESQVYVSQREAAKSERARLVFRIPAERLDEALAFIREQAEFTVERVEGKDVTEEYLDLDARLRALRAAEQRLEELLQRAEDPQDVLSVYRELVNLQAEIERIEGRIRYLEQSVAYSRVEVTFYPVRERPRVGLQWGDWNLWDTAIQALNALIALVRLVVRWAIWAVLFWLPLLLTGWLLYRWVILRVWRWFVHRKKS